MSARPTFHNLPATPEDVDDRYARQKLLGWWDQDRLAAAHVVVAGAGAIGNEVLKLLALVGVGHIVVVDFDEVSTSNLSRTVLFRAEDVGKPKAELAAARVRELNPDIHVTAIQGDIGRDLGLETLARADIVLGGLDSINARWITIRRCLMVGVPGINGGITASDVQVTRHVPGQGACYECTFTPGMQKRFLDRYSCTGLVRRVPERTVPTTAIGASVVAALQVHDALRFLHDPATGLTPGHRLTLLLDGYREYVDELPLDPDCGAHVEPIRSWMSLDEAPHEVTPAGLAQRVAEVVPGADRVRLSFDLVHRFACEVCGDVEIVGRPVTTVYEDAIRCPHCGAERVVERGAEITADSPLWQKTLDRLGVAPRDLVTVMAPSGENRAVALGGPDPWAH
jgi:adenylyltransferase/sulfurtransferase